ncbi:hypothetical protein CQW23_21302 [Capsicum baccatum]|uniref:Uncharacterized protein n=1 Tax=Capsicum baccatum TaxID=33114 RepID=A0A2G2VXP4_CAPBA|nr:hypothetical protein CQW23_21302 [Capsicum baccatum]
MSTDWTCNSSFSTKEEDKINENTLAIYFEDKDLRTKMEETLPGKSRDDIINHNNILIEDVEPIDSGRVPLPNYPEVKSYSNQNSRGRMAKRGFLDRIETQKGFGMFVELEDDFEELVRAIVGKKGVKHMVARNILDMEVGKWNIMNFGRNYRELGYELEIGTDDNDVVVFLTFLAFRL